MVKRSGERGSTIWSAGSAAFSKKILTTQFWLLHAALAGTAGITFLVAGRLFGHLLASGEKESAA